MGIKQNVNIKFKLDEFSITKEVEWNFYINESDALKRSLCYEIIICLDLMCELVLIINFKTNVVEWDKIKITITSKTTQLNRKQLRALLLSNNEQSERIKHENKQLVGILDAKYEAASQINLWKNGEYQCCTEKGTSTLTT